MKATRWLIGTLGLLFLATNGGVTAVTVAADGEGLQFVEGGQIAPLLALPGTATAPRLGELLSGTAVMVQEVRDGYARITVQAWVPSDSLTEQRPGGGGPRSPAVSEPPPAPVQDLTQAYRVRVTPEKFLKDARKHVRLTLSLITADERPVHYDQDRELETVLSFFLEKRIAGGTVRDKLLLRETVQLGSPELVWEKPVEELELPDEEVSVLVTARTSLSRDRLLFGTVRGLVLGD